MMTAGKLAVWFLGLLLISAAALFVVEWAARDLLRNPQATPDEPDEGPQQDNPQG